MSDDELEEVELLPAFAWTCPDCGADNFYRDVVVEDPNLNGDLKNAHGVSEEDVDSGEFYYGPPDTVRCNHCKVTFKAEYPFMDDDEIEFD